jgi:hypothetical protein
MLITTIWLGTLGFLDDYIKVFRKDKEGLHGKFKIIGQVGLGLIVGLTLYLSPSVVIRENVEIQRGGEIVFTDSIPYSQRCAKVKQLSIADMFAETIRRVMSNESISSQYVI